MHDDTMPVTVGLTLMAAPDLKKTVSTTAKISKTFKFVAVIAVSIELHPNSVSGCKYTSF